MTIRDYLCREAGRITDGTLAGIPDAAAWRRVETERREQFREMLGIADLLPGAQARAPVPFTVTGVIERPAYRIEKLFYESLPGLFVTANLYVPRGLAAPAAPGAPGAPGVLYVCGHAPNQKVHYQAHPRRFAELGFICLIAETVQLGEGHGYHHGCYSEGWFHWLSRGYTPAGIETLNGIRALDLLAARPDVDAARLGVTGISGGGAASWWLAAADERVRCAAPVCATATLRAHIAERTIDHHCDCMWWINTHRWDLADVGALIAPRPLLLASSDRDALNTVAGIRAVAERLERFYDLLGAPENFQFVETPGPHAYHERSRTAIFSWFLRHLMGREVPPAEAGDINDAPEMQASVATLRVYTNGPPPGDRTPTIHDDLFSPPVPPTITDTNSLTRARQHVVHALRSQTFRAFPDDPPPLDVQITQEFVYKTGRTGGRFAFTSEEGWRLHGRLLGPAGERTGQSAAGVVLTLRSPGDGLEDAEAFAGQIADTSSWAIVAVAPRGTGESSWGPEQSWHLRRAAAWTGRTIAGLRVWDTLRALEAVRGLPGVENGACLALAARGEMTVTALYAALLDGRVSALFLESPPATQNAPSAPDGKGYALEMLNCLRVTDLPQVAGLLFPARLVITGDCPNPYRWAEAVYDVLGQPEAFQHIRHPADRSPA